MIINPPPVNAYKGPVYENWFDKNWRKEPTSELREWGDNRWPGSWNLQWMLHGYELHKEE